MLMGAALLTVAPLLAGTALAAKPRYYPHATHAHGAASATRLPGSHGSSRTYAWKRGARFRLAYYRPRLQCVTFARAASGIELKGNAANWWDAAAGVYERGDRPEPGSVLNFRSNGHMRLGHVAVVTAVLDSRRIEIEHANWAGPGANRGGVARGISVIDVSPNNDWTAVRVSLGRGSDYGSIYPTYGFIYDRPDRGTVMANSGGMTPTVLSIDELTDAPARHVGTLATDPNLIPDGPSRDVR
jgi:surface antigen